MSLSRLVYYSAVVGGWAAFFAWLLAEVLILRGGGGTMQVLAITALVGGFIGAGLNVVAGAANAQWKEMLRRLLPGLLGGGLGGAVGGLLGNLLFVYLSVPRALGWMIMGLGIGVVDGLYEGSRSKIRNGLIGGGLGGLVGGILFDPITNLVAAGSGMSSRATAFVILGLCIGALIGVAQVVFKEAWLTVLDGYRAGRQLILGQDVTTLGRGEHLPLPFLGPMNRDLEPEHLRIIRQPNGSYTVEDNNSRLGTRLNGELAQGAVRLKDGDVIKLATNFVRFNERQGRSQVELEQAKTSEPQTHPDLASGPPRPTMPPPPPSRGKSTAAVATPAAPSPIHVQPTAEPASAESAASPGGSAAAVNPPPPKPAFPAPPAPRVPAPAATSAPSATPTAPGQSTSTSSTKSGGTIRPVPPRPKLPGK